MSVFGYICRYTVANISFRLGNRQGDEEEVIPMIPWIHTEKNLLGSCVVSERFEEANVTDMIYSIDELRWGL